MEARKFIWIFSFFAVIFLINSTCSFADSIPPLPASYYGSITINGSLAGEGLHVDSCIDRIGRNRKLIQQGKYGYENHLKLYVAGSSEEKGKTVYFCVGDRRSNEDFPWIPGEIKEVPLTFTDKTEGCPACFVEWVCNKWSACYKDKFGEYVQICTKTGIVDKNNCGTTYLKPEELIQDCQGEDTTNGDTTNGNNGGGGSSGGTSSPTTTENKTDNTTTQSTQEPESSEDAIIHQKINKNQEAIFDFLNSKVSSIKILFNEQVENPSLTVEIFNEKPAGVSEISGNKIVYKYISVDKNFDSAKVKQATIKFKVETSWMAENKVGSENIVLLHFNINGWEEVPTTLTGTEGEFYKFEAETGTLSLFAIVAKEKQSKFNVIHFVVIFLIIICLVAFFIKMKTKPQKKYEIKTSKK